MTSFPLKPHIWAWSTRDRASDFYLSGGWFEAQLCLPHWQPSFTGDGTLIETPKNVHVKQNTQRCPWCRSSFKRRWPCREMDCNAGETNCVVPAASGTFCATENTLKWLLSAACAILMVINLKILQLRAIQTTSFPAEHRDITSIETTKRTTHPGTPFIHVVDSLFDEHDEHGGVWLKTKHCTYCGVSITRAYVRVWHLRKIWFGEETDTERDIAR